MSLVKGLLSKRQLGTLWSPAPSAETPLWDQKKRHDSKFSINKLVVSWLRVQHAMEVVPRVCIRRVSVGRLEGRPMLHEHQRCPKENHLEERLLDQAQTRASYTPLFWGHSRSIPQGMIFDVQPLVKSLFCPIRPSPNGFFDSEASIP